MRRSLRLHHTYADASILLRHPIAQYTIFSREFMITIQNTSVVYVFMAVVCDVRACVLAQKCFVAIFSLFLSFNDFFARDRNPSTCSNMRIRMQMR